MYERKLSLRWLAFALAIGVGIGLFTNANAQPVTNLQPSGQECWNAGQGPGGPSSFLCINQVRNTAGLSSNTIALGSAVVQGTRDMNTLLVTGQPAQGTTIVTPANPIADGQTFQVCNGTTANFATNTAVLTAASPQSLNNGTATNGFTNISLTTLATKTCVEVIFQLATQTWFQIR